MEEFFLQNSKTWARIRSCGIIIIDEEVLMVTNKTCGCYYSLGGGLKVGETLEKGCLREVEEETNLKMEIERLVFIHENFFYDKYNNRQCHEIAFYFLLKTENIRKESFDLNHHSYGLGGIKETLVWVPLKDYSKYKAFPTFFKDYLGDLPKEVKHIVTHEY